MKKKASPAIIAMIMIAIVAVIGVAWTIIDKYIPTKEVMEDTEYFGITSQDELGVIMQDQLSDEKAFLKDGAVYLPYTMVSAYLTDHFYRDESENQMIFTTPTNIIKIPEGGASYTSLSGDGTMPYDIITIQNGAPYIALDYIKQFCDVEYTLYEGSTHVLVNYKWGTRSFSDVKKHEAVRYEANIKSPILTNTAAGDTVTVLEQEKKWSKVLTQNGYIGYMRNKCLNDTYDKEVTTDFEEEVYTSIHQEEPVNLVWHQITNTDSNAYLEQDMAEATGVNVISPTWFSCTDNEGNFTNLADKDYVDTAHKKGWKVWGLIDNFSADMDTVTLLGTTDTREALEDNLIQAVQDAGMDGINIDFESLREEASGSYIQFMRELSVKCRNAQIVLSVDVPPPYDFNMHYNRKALGEVVDYIIVMGYDEHYVGSEAGSVASLSYEENGISGMLQEVAADKIVSGIPFYTRLWKTNSAGEVSSEALGMDNADAAVSDAKVTASWNEETSQDYAEFTDGDGNYCQIWLENEDSLAKKVALVNQNGLAGVAAWKLGYERASIWKVISDGLKK